MNGLSREETDFSREENEFRKEETGYSREQNDLIGFSRKESNFNIEGKEGNALKSKTKEINLAHRNSELGKHLKEEKSTKEKSIKDKADLLKKISELNEREG